MSILQRCDASKVLTNRAKAIMLKLALPQLLPGTAFSKIVVIPFLQEIGGM